MTRNILVKAPADPPIAQISAAAPGSEAYQVDELDVEACQALRLELGSVGAVLGASPRDDLSFLPSLAWVHSTAAGVDAWLATGTVPGGAVLTSAAGNGAIPLAEHAMMLMLMLSRNAPRWLVAQQEHRWDRFVHGELAGSALGIIGYGNSGRDLALKASAFQMRVRALRRTPADGDDDSGVRLLSGRDGLRELLVTSDYLAVTAPLTAETRGLIGAEELGLMRPSARVVVVSRGGIVEEDALLRALGDGRLAGAGLDAHAIEPLPAHSPLWEMPNVIVTPHNGATTSETAERGRAILLDNVARWAAGRPLRNVVGFDRGY